jgi:hypothetical protein
LIQSICGSIISLFDLTNEIMLPQNKVQKFYPKENFNLDINIYKKEHKKITNFLSQGGQLRELIRKLLFVN